MQADIMKLVKYRKIKIKTVCFSSKSSENNFRSKFDYTEKVLITA